MHKQKVQYKVEIFQVNKLNNICCSTERYTDELQECGSTRISFGKSFSQLPYLRTEHQKAMQRQSLPLQSTCSPLHGNDKRLEKETSKLFNLFLINRTNPDPSKFQGVCMDDIPSEENIVRIIIFIYDIDFIDGALFGEIARRSIKKKRKKIFS